MEKAEADWDEGLYPVALWGYFGMVALMFIVVNRINAPYERHVKRGWGFGVAVREAWIIMESPALFVMALVYHTGRFHFLHIPHVLLSPQFLLDATLCLGGFACNFWADNVLLNLRTDKADRSYKIARGFLFEYVTCPSYLSEVVEWLGWAIMTNSLAGFAFFVASLANLGPRAKAHQQWYFKKFSDYPRSRKALIPLIY